MTTELLEKLKYPIGKFEAPKVIDSKRLSEWINDIQGFPAAMIKETQYLSDKQLKWLYRPGGWSIQQLVHHCADSHMNAFMRFKLTLTENTPHIRPYLEALWAKLPDADNNDISDSLLLIQGLHSRWVRLLNGLTEEDLSKMFYHPEHKTNFALREVIGQYAWHAKHHLAHVRQALKHSGGFE